MALDKAYFSRAGNERRTGQDYAGVDDYFESYAQVLAAQTRGRVLDLGCGYGYLTKRIAEREEVEKVVGLDKLNEAKVSHPKIEYQTQDLTSPEPLSKDSYDVVVSSEFVEHITEDEFRVLLGRVAAVLQPEGTFIGSTPRNPTPYPVFSGSRFHLREYNQEDLEGILRERFGSVQVRPVSKYCLVWEAKEPKTQTEMASTSLKLHIGCGEKYLPGYVNIDYPPAEHTVMKVRADVYEDIRALDYPEGSVDEVRNHHLFEHFSRTEALKLLFAWRRWLKPDGLLVIETPDFQRCARAYTFALSEHRRLQLGRHMLGSQEAKWAYHYDFWDKPKYKYVLKVFGFKRVRIRRFSNSFAQHYSPYSWTDWLFNIAGNLLPEGMYRKYGGHKLPNIVVTARKDGTRQPILKEVALQVLGRYLVGREGEEMLSVWLRDI